ncbi:MAG TPA: PPK2 family polyphosphate kinase [Actinotalea sp.]
MGKKHWTTSPQDALRIPPGFDLSAFDRGSTPGWSGSKADAERYLAKRGGVLTDLQERLFAQGRSGGTASVLLVLQGMDTAGKGGIVRHVLGLVDPQGVALRSFGVPTEVERAHNYLWRIRKALPAPGLIGVFDRSHYEDVLVVRVEELVPRAVWEPRYDEINAFEQKIVDGGTPVVKVALVVSLDEQAERLRERIERPDKHWKYNPGDIEARERWPLYQEAYQAVLDRTSTTAAPWHVIPGDHKWYARLAVTELLIGALEGLHLDWPAADFDIPTELRRLDESKAAMRAMKPGQAAATRA